MNNLQNILPAKLFETLQRAGISTIKQIITLSHLDIKKCTNMCKEDIVLVKHLVSKDVRPKIVTCELLVQSKNLEKVTTGCKEIDELLNGGYRRGTITEIYGESGCGKTQLAMQAAIHTWQTGSVFICTEDLFPVKRFEQLKKSVRDFDTTINYGQNIFVEHLTEPHDLLSCVRVRLPKLLSKHRLSLIIIDSVAAPFRCESTNYIQRAEDLRELAMQLISLARQYNLAVVCINQVTASFVPNIDLLPCLGLAWSNLISCRLWVNKTSSSIDAKKIVREDSNYNFFIRELVVIFSPDVKRTKIQFIIKESGVFVIR